jgi:hypothetical protein
LFFKKRTQPGYLAAWPTRQTTGLNVQVVCDLSGRLAWISDPVDGCRHDTAALETSGVVHTLDPAHWMGDKGCIGNNMLTPIRKPPHRTLLDWEKEFNTAINKIRYRIEQTIANFKPGEYSTSTIAGPSLHSRQQSQPSSLWSSPGPAVNNPHFLGNL